MEELKKVNDSNLLKHINFNQVITLTSKYFNSDDYEFVCLLMDIFKYLDLVKLDFIIKVLLGLEVKGNNKDKYLKLLAFFLNLYSKDSIVIKKSISNFRNLLKLTKKSFESFIGLTLKRRKGKYKEDYKKLFVKYFELVLKYKCIYFVDKYAKENVLVKIPFNTNLFNFKLKELFVYDLINYKDKLYIKPDYFENTEDLSVFSYLDIFYKQVKSFNYASSLKIIGDFKKIEKLYEVFEEITPCKYCYYCNDEPTLKNNFTIDGNDIKLNKSQKHDKCPICTYIFNELTHFNQNDDAKKIKIPLEKVILIKAKINRKINNKIRTKQINYKNIAEKKRIIIAHTILTYPSIKEIYEKYKFVGYSTPKRDDYSNFDDYYNEHVTFCKVNNFRKLIRLIRYHFKIKKTEKQRYYEGLYLDK